MPYNRRFTHKMADLEIGIEDVSVVDVYDIAADIGKECEVIIDKFGADAVTSLLPKVISALELLENLAVKHEKENTAVQELTVKISQLENDKVEKAEYRQRFEKELEGIEEQWRVESSELVSAVARLQEENRRLRRAAEGEGGGAGGGAGGGESGGGGASPARARDLDVLQRLAATAERQRGTLRDQEIMLQERQQVIDSLSTQVERLTSTNRDFRRKNKQIQSQIRSIAEERSELGAIVDAQKKELEAAQQKQSAACPGAGGDEAERALFSSREMRAVLGERDALKQRLQAAEEQLAALQQRSDSPEDTSSSCGGADEDAPVQGPLPAEPDDAPWKRQHGGIRKFFRKLFTESEGHVAAFPRLPRSSLSSLASKMAAGAAVTSATAS